MKRLLTLGFLIVMVIAGINFQPFLVSSENAGGNKEEIDELNQEIAEKRDKIKQIEESIAEYQSKIKDKRAESVSLSNQLTILDNRIMQVEMDIEATEAKIEATTLEIKSLDLSIEDKEIVIKRQRNILQEMIRTLHYENQKKYIEILAAYENFSDFYSRVQYLKKIESDLGQGAKTVRLAKEELEEKKQISDERKKSLEDLNKKLSNRKKDLSEQSFLKQTTLAQAQSSELTFKTMVNNLKSQYQQIESEINSIERQVRSRLESQDKLEDLDDENLLSWPSQSRYVTAYFHDPDYPYRHVFEHSGIDIRAAHGTPLKAVASGYVARAKHCTSSSCYSYIMLVHSNGISTVYGHMSKILVGADQFVARGDVIGYSGGTPGTVGAGPFVTGPHLHFEVRKNGIPVNPLGYLVKDW